METYYDFCRQCKGHDLYEKESGALLQHCDCPRVKRDKNLDEYMDIIKDAINDYNQLIKQRQLIKGGKGAKNNTI